MRKILLFLFVVVMAGGFWLVASYTDRPGEVETTENALDIQPLPVLGDRWPATAEARFEALESAIAALRDEWVRAIDQQARSLTVELQPAIANLSSRVAGLEQQSRSSSPEGEGPDPVAMKTTLDTLMQELGRLSRRVDDVDRSARRNRQVRRKRKNTQPPFRAEAIDWWGDTPSVVIRDGERTLFLSPGDVLGGWRLTGVDAHSALFERDGKRTSLAVSP